MASVSSTGEIQFDDILRAEVDAINRRRVALGRAKLSAGICAGTDGKVLDAIGLTLSGGGIRSAALSLGVLQAFNHHDALRNVDYLSTVSGGGYMGSALTATMTCTGGKFVFGNAPVRETDQAAAEIADTPAVGHLRNYANYLVPGGARDLLTGTAIVLRGLAANFAIVLPFVLLLAAATILTNPYRSSLGCPELFKHKLCDYLWVESFGITLVLALAGLAGFFLWALYRSFLAADKQAEFRTTLPVVATSYLVFLAIVFFVELQTFFIEGMFQIADSQKLRDLTSLEWVTSTVKTLAAIAVPITAVVTFFRQQMGDILKAANSTANISTKVIAVLSRIAFWVAGAAIPLLVWVAYLYLAYWGIINNYHDVVNKEPQTTAAPAQAPTKIKLPACSPTPPTTAQPKKEENDEGDHTPDWMMRFATFITQDAFCPAFMPRADASEMSKRLFVQILDRPMVLLYGSVGLLLIIVTLCLRPNANSLHRLYRDRLSKAFLFDPRKSTEPAEMKPNEASIDQGRDFPQLDDMPLSKLSDGHAPYHLINAALNIQGSDYANRRGRNADFFLFSPHYVGSEATGYAPTVDFESAVKDLNLATAMAISGAAASSNMGAKSIRPLRPTLALLNIRLGYWLKNPRFVPRAEGPPSPAPGGLPTLFLWSEISGRLYENSNNVYLTDGGHIENLGVYELLKRRCKLIIVVDGEADFNLRFPSFITLQRYARIDLGIRIDMPWDAIRTTTCSWMGLHSGKEDSDIASTDGPHAAIGTIDYGERRTGHILYLKASLSGDENDYIRDYARRFVRFPHETTGDQFFSEEQFEVYRSLGFHIAHGVLSGRDDVCAPGSPCSFHSKANKVVKEVRDALVPHVPQHHRAARKKAITEPIS